VLAGSPALSQLSAMGAIPGRFSHLIDSASICLLDIRLAATFLELRRAHLLLSDVQYLIFLPDGFSKAQLGGLHPSCCGLAVA